MIGITSIGSFIPEARQSNLDKTGLFDTDEHFIKEKLGIVRIAVAEKGEASSDLCLKAFNALESRTGIARGEVDAVVVVTQTPGEGIPHVSATLHGLLDLSPSCACFDISLGCSGYVYGLNVLKSLMEANQLRSGLLFTGDPYSKIVDPGDKNTAMLFGDAATVTHLSADAIYDIGRGTANTLGKEGQKLATSGGVLRMNGRAVFNFTAQRVPPDILKAIEINGLELDDIDRFLIHQGSKFIVDTIVQRLKLPPEKVPFAIADYGNTVSSSIPLLLEHELAAPAARHILVSGFGVGLSWASTVLSKRD